MGCQQQRSGGESNGDDDVDMCEQIDDTVNAQTTVSEENVQPRANNVRQRENPQQNDKHVWMRTVRQRQT
jgi:hypothetical protein